MLYDDSIIVVYLLAEALYQNIVTKPIKNKGFLPALSNKPLLLTNQEGKSKLNPNTYQCR